MQDLVVRARLKGKGILKPESSEIRELLPTSTLLQIGATACARDGSRAFYDTIDPMLVYFNLKALLGRLPLFACAVKMELSATIAFEAGDIAVPLRRRFGGSLKGTHVWRPKVKHFVWACRRGLGGCTLEAEGSIPKSGTPRHIGRLSMCRYHRCRESQLATFLL